MTNSDNCIVFNKKIFSVTVALWEELVKLRVINCERDLFLFLMQCQHWL